MTDHRIMEFWERSTTRLLEVTVVGCYNLENRGPVGTEYSCFLQYGGYVKQTKPWLGGGPNPIFEEKFVFPFTDGVRELNIAVKSSQSPGNEQFIAFLSLQKQQILFDGSADSTWSLRGRDGRPAGGIRLKLQVPSSNSTFQGHYSSWTAPTLDCAAPRPPMKPDATQTAVLYQLLPYDGVPVPGPNVPYSPTYSNATGPAAVWSQLLPYGSPPPAAPACVYNPTTSPPAGYPLPFQLQPHPQYPIYPPTPPGRVSGPSSGIYPPPPRWC